MTIFKKLMSVVQEDVIGSENRWIAGAWISCVLGLIGLGLYLSSESMSFLGVAESREVQINFEYPVEIKRIHIIPGQVVKKGDLLLELNQSDLDTRMRIVRSQLAKLQAEYSLRARLNDLVGGASYKKAKGESAESSDPLAVDIREYENELSDLEAQKKSLYVFSEISGIVGGVNFKRGEKVPAFASVLTVSPGNPTFVEGFVHESLQTRLEIGKVVKVTPISTSSAPVEGRIVSVGSRIIAIPLRLMPHPNMQAWGREVVVEIPEESGFLLGEKVQIKPRIQFLRFSTAIASTDSTAKAVAKEDMEPTDVDLPASVGRRLKFEPSGAIYLDDLKKFLVVSDDTDKDDTPALFLMDREGKVDDQALVVAGLGAVSDLESISQSDGFIYLMTSQGLNKKGVAKTERSVFARIERKGLKVSVSKKVALRDTLLDALKASKLPEMAELNKALKEQDLEIEGHFVADDELLLALKSPLVAGTKSVIIEIKGVESIFAKGQIAPEQITRLRFLDFGAVEGMPHRLSDLIQINGRMYASSVCNDETCGAVWSLHSIKGTLTPEKLRSYADLKPEALAFDPREGSIFVTFDRGQKKAKFARISLQNHKSKSDEN